MFTIIYLYIILFVVAIVAYYTLDRQTDKSSARICHLGLFLILLFFAAFRDGNLLPDYGSYIHLYQESTGKRLVEQSFYTIQSISRWFFPYGGGEYLMFFLYSLLGISIKYYAITKYSPYVVFSICIWISSFYILQDMIQIRASVAGSLLLLIIPFIQQRRYIAALVLASVSFYFHNSAIFFFPLMLLNPERINKYFWTLGYVLVIGINLLRVNIGHYIAEFLTFIPKEAFNDRILTYTFRAERYEMNALSMFSPYILYQTIVCFTTMHFAEKLMEKSPYSILLIKTAFIGVFFYGLSIPGVTMRLAELFSTSLILLTPMIIYLFPDYYKRIGGGYCIITRFR